MGIRFFSDGRVLMVLSYNPPYKIVRKLQTREKAPFNVSPGHYRLSGKQLFLTLDSEDKERDREFNRKYGWEDNTERKTTYNMVWYQSFETYKSLTYLLSSILAHKRPSVLTKINVSLRCPYLILKKNLNFTEYCLFMVRNSLLKLKLILLLNSLNNFFQIIIQIQNGKCFVQSTDIFLLNSNIISELKLDDVN